MKAEGPWRRAGGHPSRRGPGLRQGSEDPMVVAPHQRSTSDHLLIIWQGPSAGRPAGEGGLPGSCDRVAGVAAPLAYPGGVSGYRPMSLPTAILTLTPLTPLTPQKGCFGGRKGGGGEGGGEGTPRVHGQGTGPLEPISSKGGARAALPFPQGTCASSVEERVRSHEQGPPDSAWSARPPSPPRLGRAASLGQLPRSAPRNMNRRTLPRTSGSRSEAAVGP